VLGIQYHVVISPGVWLPCSPTIFNQRLRREDDVEPIGSVGVFDCFVRDAGNCQDNRVGVGFLKRLVCSRQWDQHVGVVNLPKKHILINMMMLAMPGRFRAQIKPRAT